MSGKVTFLLLALYFGAVERRFVKVPYSPTLRAPIEGLTTFAIFLIANTYRTMTEPWMR
jgi:hypothetical protein